MSFCIADRGNGASGVPRGARGPLRVLFVTPYLPSPPRFGGQRRLHGLISGIAAKHDVSTLSLVDADEDHAEAVRATRAYCRKVATVPSRRRAASTAMKRLLQIQSLLTPRSYEWLAHREDAFAKTLDSMLAEDRYDVVHFEFPYMASYKTRKAHRNGAGPVFLLDEHNIEYDIIRQTADAGGGLFRRAYSAINWRKLRAEELSSWTRLDGCTLTSARDQERLLADAPKTRTAVVPNGVDLESFRLRESPAPIEPKTLLFFGAIDYYPNTDGLRFFLDEVMPRLRAQIPGVRLRVVGKSPPEEILARRAPDVEVTGEVPDVRPHIERAAAVVVPLRLGGGTRLKVLEAMAMGKAVISTTLGVEGLDVKDGRDVLIADDPEGFVKQTERLFGDAELTARLGEAARRLVEARYGWNASVARLSDFYGEVLESRGAR